MPSSIPDSAPRFDLQGHRVDSSYKGVVVCQGRKFVQR